jgi:hypothetical protein
LVLQYQQVRSLLLTCHRVVLRTVLAPPPVFLTECAIHTARPAVSAWVSGRVLQCAGGLPKPIRVSPAQPALPVGCAQPHRRESVAGLRAAIRGGWCGRFCLVRSPVSVSVVCVSPSVCQHRFPVKCVCVRVYVRVCVRVCVRACGCPLPGCAPNVGLLVVSSLCCQIPRQDIPRDSVFHLSNLGDLDVGFNFLPVTPPFFELMPALLRVVVTGNRPQPTLEEEEAEKQRLSEQEQQKQQKKNPGGSRIRRKREKEAAEAAAAVAAAAATVDNSVQVRAPAACQPV